MDLDEDEELVYNQPAKVSSNAQQPSRDGGLFASTVLEKTVGTWFFDKRDRKRKYVALTGKVYTGPDAIRIARQDQQSEQNPTRTARYELKYGHMITSRETVMDLLGSTPTVCDNPLIQLCNWGLPKVVLARYAKNKVERLFAWQIDCLTVGNGCILSGNENLVYSAPTSGGKTLVSEILMLRQLARFMPSHADAIAPATKPPGTGAAKRRHTVFFVVPFVALAEEKAAYFQDMWQDMNISVKAFHGDGGDIAGSVLGEDVEVAVCTIERANILLTQLLDERREDQLKMVVVDEIHMLADAQRGFLLEVILSKIKYLLKDQVQVVGMSATLPNIADLAGWLGASLYTTQYRPVDLEVKVCVDRCLYALSKTAQPPTSGLSSVHGGVLAVTATGEETLPVDPLSTALCAPVANPTALPVVQYDYDNVVGMLPEDPDGMKRLCLDTVLIGKSVMLFCNSKRRCEVCASAVAESISKHLHTIIEESLPKAAVAWGAPPQPGGRTGPHSSHSAGATGDAAMRAGRFALIEALSQTQVGLCPVLRLSLPHGVAYHHAGLTLDERKIVEDGFRQGFIQVLCTTSTLSAGVNLPAHRVIIRSPRMGDKFLNVAGFRQMCGRAGRMGLDAKGEAILMIMGGNKVEKGVADHLLTADLDPLRSHLHIGVGGGLEKLLLEMIICGRLQNESAVMEFIDCTLMRVQQEATAVLGYTKEALIFLKKEQFVQALSEGQLSPTPLGIATTMSGIAPKDAVQILRPLLDARAKLILKGGLHPVYLVTPPSTPIEPDWKNYEKILHVLYQEHPDAEAVATYLGIEQGQLCSYAFNNPPRSNTTPKVQLYRRFFSAILLFTLIQEWPITNVTRLLSTVTRGQLQQLQKDAAVFCGMTVVFCKKLNWPLLASCLSDFSGRLNYGVHKDILPLVRLGSEITAARARVFLKNGVESAQDIMYAGLPLLTELLVESLPYDGKDPLQVGTSSGTGEAGHNTGNAPPREGSVGAGGAKSKEFARVTCERLAKKIISRAKEYLQEEASRLNMYSGGELC